MRLGSGGEVEENNSGCERLNAPTGEGDTDGFLQFRIDYAEDDGSSEATASSPPPMATQSNGVVEDELACTAPGQERTTRFSLLAIQSGQHARALPISGERQHAYAEVTAVEVVDWKGQDSLTIDRPTGPITLTAAQPVASFDSGDGMWMGALSWQLPAAGLGPIVEVTHRCPDEIPAAQQTVPVAYPMSWALLDETLTAAAGFSLDTLLPEATAEADWPAILLRIVPSAIGPTHVLNIESHTGGVLMTYPLTEEEGLYAFQHTGPEGAFTGTITPSEDGLAFSLSEGSIHTPAGDISLSPFSINLPGYPNAPAQ